LSQTTTEGAPVPPLNLAGNFRQVREQVLAEITAICDSGQYVLGPKVEAFERVLAEYCGARFALGLSSGTDALLLALMALGVGRGDEVIVPTFTFFATAGTVHRLGARPVFVDIEPETFNLDPTQVHERMTPRTKAVVPVHLYGLAADMRAVCAAVGRHGVAVIEDAAQSIGATCPDYPDRRTGAIGTFGALSFYPTKNLGAIGDAGALLTNDERLFELARKLRIHGSGHTYYHEMVGGNFRIDALQAAILQIKLGHLEEWNARRRAVAGRYTRLLEEAGLVPELVRPPGAGSAGRAAADGYGPNHVFHQYVIRARRRDELLEHLRARRIGAGVYYPLALHLQQCFAYLGHKPGDFPHAERAAAEVLALPIYPELTDAQQQAVVLAIADFYQA
jgi:dTDP-4-amino-4,6-dideoxygalactose transaminase